MEKASPDIGATLETNVSATKVALVVEEAVQAPLATTPNPDLARDYFERAVGYGEAGELQLAIGDFT